MSASAVRRTLLAVAVVATTALGSALLADQRDHDRASRNSFTVSAGDVTADSAVIWSRATRRAVMHVLLEGDGPDRKSRKVAVVPEDDYTGKVRFSGLRPNTEYEYKVWFDSDDGHAASARVAEGRFRTAPRDRAVEPVSFAWGGDVGGQNVCRDATEGMPVFGAINASDPDFFIGLGDMIYADGVCDAIGLYGNNQVPGAFLQAATMQDYWAHWKYNLEEPGYRKLLSRKPLYAIWDDHEVVNDFGPLHDTRTAAPYTPGVHLLPMGLKAMLDYNPILPAEQTPDRLYRNFRWGKHLELFILDTRQYRDANFTADNALAPKTVLGREQLSWLKTVLGKSDATWKVIVSSVPMSIPTGSAGAAGRDGWANFTQTGGFELELLDILGYMQQNYMNNVLWITTDVHFSEAFRYTPFSDAPDFQVHEVVTGPLNAGVFPNANFDATLGTESLFRYPLTQPVNYEEAKTHFNYGFIRIGAGGDLTASINGITGAALFELTLFPR